MSLFMICALSCQSVSPQAVQSQAVEVRVEDVVVIGRRGAARVAPETELNPDQIDALGAYDIGEAIARIGEGLGLDRPPVLIVNGRRVVNPGDFLGFPPDALERVEVLPQQAAAIYGSDPAQRVVNLVLRPRFVSRDGQVSAERPSAGGRTSAILDARQSSIRDTDVSQYGARLSRDTALYGAERPDYVADNPGREGVTLRPAVAAVAANATIRRALGDWSSSLGARVQRRTDRSAARIGDAIIDSRRSTDVVALTGGLSGELAGWAVRLGLDGQATRAEQRGLSDLRSRTVSTAVDLGADRTLYDLPAGPLIVNLTSRYGRFASDIETAGVDTRRSADTLDVGASLSIPLTRARPAPEGRGLWGDTSATLGATLRETDGASGTGLRAGLFWSPVRKLRINGQWSTITESPTAQQRFDSPIFGEPRTVFDFATGEAVEILPLLGGNPALRAPTSDLTSLAVTAGPFTSWAVLGGVNFQTVSATDGIGGLPTLTPEVEAAFPDRIQRDAEGRLTVIDQRPINLDETRLSSLSSNLNLTVPSDRAPIGGPWRIGLTHTLQVENRLTLGGGLPELDRLAGDGGGVPRHQVSMQLDGRVDRIGLNVSARWRGGSRIRRDAGRDGPDDVVLDPVATLDLKLSYLMSSRVSNAEGEGARRGSGIRLELEIDNLIDARPQASLGDGRVAPGYERDDRDPLGRIIRVTASRRF